MSTQWKKNRPKGISPSDLTFLWNECRRCFWLRYRKDLRRPFSMPGLVSVISELQETQYRDATSADFSPSLPSGRVHSTGAWVESAPLVIRGEATDWCIRGKYDFLMQYDDATWGIIDTKFTGKLGEKTGFYSPQIEAYAFALENPRSGAPRPVSTVGLMVWAPSQIVGTHGAGFQMAIDHEYQPARRDPEAFSTLLSEVMLLIGGDIPAAHDVCPYCTWLVDRLNVN